MSDETSSPAVESTILERTGLGAVLVAYAVLLGAAYLFSFWRPLGFSIFPYLSLNDYIAAPLNRLSVLLAAPVVFAVVVYGNRTLTQSKLWSNLAFYLAVLYCIIFVQLQSVALWRYFQHNFHFDNEGNVLWLGAALFAASCVLWVRVLRKPTPSSVALAALVLVQVASALAAGYGDGKAIYNGAVQVHWLASGDPCGSDGQREWIYLGRYGGETFFLHAADKRICITSSKDLRLVSRQRSEGL